MEEIKKNLYHGAQRDIAKMAGTTEPFVSKTLSDKYSLLTPLKRSIIEMAIRIATENVADKMAEELTIKYIIGREKAN